MIKEYLMEAINLELNMSKLYLKFSNINNTDYIFWYSLSVEEGGHAAILKNILSAIDMIEYNFNITDIELNDLKNTNDNIDVILSNTYNRYDAFNIAMSLENSAGEIHYQKLIDSNIDDKIMKVFLKLNKDDNEHANRILDYMTTHNIV
jgi:rubrerythrin